MSDYGFPRHARLLSAGEFRNVFDNVEVKASSKYLLILSTPNATGNPRIGFVFSKKNIKLAVHRNHLKRLIRESFRLKQKNLPDIDMVILARKGISDLDNQTIRHELDKLWHRLAKKYPSHH